MPNYSSSIIAGLGKPKLLGAQPASQQAPSRMSPGNLYRDPSLDVDEFNTGMINELRDRRFQASRLGERPEATALAGLENSYQDDFNASPLRQQGKEVEALRIADANAMNQGFNGQGMGEAFMRPSTQANLYERGRQEFKENIPFEVAKIGGQADVAAAKARAQGQIDVERERWRGQQGQMEQFQSLINGVSGANGSGRSLNRMSAPGGWSATFEPEEEMGIGGIPASLLTRLAGTFSRAGVANEADRPAIEAEQQALQQQALGRARLSTPELHTWVSSILSDPELRKSQFDDILTQWFLQYPDDQGAFLPEEQEEARQILAALRGF